MPSPPEAAPSYGVLEQRAVESEVDRAAEDVSYLGYAVVPGGYSAAEIEEIARLFDEAHREYVALYTAAFLEQIDELNGIRLPLAFCEAFIDLAMNPTVLGVVKKVVRNAVVLNQQNGIINPPGQNYNQAAWHRDLPYQHFVASRPLAINALYCVDDFKPENGATFVLPGTHLREEYPSEAFISRNAAQISAPAGSFIMLDCMLFHRGGSNSTASRRRGVNHVYTTAFIKQQIDIPSALGREPPQSAAVAELLGYRYQMPRSVADFLKSRVRP
jgi:hypothetical protein